MAGGGSAGLLAAGALAARARHDRALTERLARAAIAEGAGFDARYVAAEAAHSQGRPAQAERELATLAADAASDPDRARVALLRFDNAYFLHGQDAGLRLIDEAVQVITDPFWRDELLTRRFFIMSLSRGPRVAVEAASALLQHPGSRRLTTAAHAALFYSLVRLGRLDEAIQLLSPAPEAQRYQRPMNRGNGGPCFSPLSLGLCGQAVWVRPRSSSSVPTAWSLVSRPRRLAPSSPDGSLFCGSNKAAR
jgi:hypothetical protein